MIKNFSSYRYNFEFHRAWTFYVTILPIEYCILNCYIYEYISSQVKDILLHNITSVHTLNTETEAHWGVFASVILAFVTISWPHWETKTRISKGAICQCVIPCCDGRHHIVTITWNEIISAIKLWYSTILASYLFVHEICSHILFEKINGGGILNV